MQLFSTINPVYITRNTNGLNYFDFCALESFRVSLGQLLWDGRLSPDSHNVLVPQDLPPGPASAHVHITRSGSSRALSYPYCSLISPALVLGSAVLERFAAFTIATRRCGAKHDEGGGVHEVRSAGGARGEAGAKAFAQGGRGSHPDPRHDSDRKRRVDQADGRQLVHAAAA